MPLSKTIRQQVYNKYDGHCAYCGKEIAYKQMQVDHLKPAKRECKRNPVTKKIVYFDSKFTDNSIGNLMPACGRCNRYKQDFPLEEFRRQISMQVERGRKNSWSFVCAEDYGLIVVTNNPVVFYFEKMERQ